MQLWKQAAGGEIPVPCTPLQGSDPAKCPVAPGSKLRARALTDIRNRATLCLCLCVPEPQESYVQILPLI